MAACLENGRISSASSVIKWFEKRNKFPQVCLLFLVNFFLKYCLEILFLFFFTLYPNITFCSLVFTDSWQQRQLKQNLRVKLSVIVKKMETHHPFLMSHSYDHLRETIQSFLDNYLKKNPSDFLVKVGCSWNLVLCVKWDLCVYPPKLCLPRFLPENHHP